jgi:hypothetical protein
VIVYIKILIERSFALEMRREKLVLLLKKMNDLEVQCFVTLEVVVEMRNEEIKYLI